MSAMFSGLFAATAFSAFLCSSASPSYPELNPALGKYQNVALCIPFEETWYSVYRNYETDPAFGSMDMCTRFTSTGPGVNGTYPFMVQYGQSSANLTGTLSSSEGYTAKNVIHMQAPGQNVSLTVYVAYLDCHECTVFRNIYAGEWACTLLVPESALGRNETCCEFVFDLLCGTGQKYYIYNETCPT
ncbi:uncharacterized protein LOC120839169 [Ixodes scapularis]|uniref:uncharacterized protein LOC120839169 n=1 Tax=Ixodes scapularis TaxID=6945 RepID=UPI001A9D06D8|nr:uncharacterized protein LOC120839169 [Ixodes scapularis]